MAIGIYSNSGNDVRLLKDQLDLNGTAKVLTGTDDPRSVAKNAPQGSLYLQTGATGGKLFKKLDAGSSTNWTEVGSGAGGINYILNPDAEAGTTGWATYADAAATTPVDGTGGSPTVTFTTSSSSPLRGNNSFLITKDAANRQGQGASYAFAIDQADRAQVIAIEFDYAVASGTFAAGDSSDIRVFVYDVTNAVLITPTPFTIQSNTQSNFKGLFQSASNSSSYRLIFHCATTSASAYTLKIDNVRVGPQSVVYGSPVTDWTAFTPAWTASTSNPTIGDGSISGVWRRVGDSIEVRGYILYGSTTANGTGTYYFGFPSGVTIDTTKLVGATGQNDTLGEAVYHNNGVAIYPMVVKYDTTQRVTLAFQSGTPISESGQLASTSGGSNGDEIFWTVRFPVVGWGSSVQVSNDAETRVVAARYTTTAGQSIPNNTNTVLDFGTKDFDTHGAVTTGASWRYTAPLTGYYRVTVCATFTANGGGTRAGIIRKNGVDHSVIDSQLSFGSGQTDAVQGSALVQLNPGDYIDLVVFQNTGGAKSMDTTGTGNYIAVDRVSGPSAIAANELVAGRATRSTNQSVATATTDIIAFDSIATNGFDTHSAINLTTGRITVPVAGKYLLGATVILSSSSTGWRIVFYKNGSAVSQAFSAVSSADHETVTQIISAAPGDILDVRFTNNTGGSLTINGSADSEATTVFFHRVGF